MNSLIKMAGVLVFMALLSLGCEKKEAGTAAPAKEQTTTQAVAKQQTECPVMAGKIDKNIFTDYQGKRVYFCCPDCLDTFKEEPEKYVKQMTDKGIVLENAPAAAK